MSIKMNLLHLSLCCIFIFTGCKNKKSESSNTTDTNEIKTKVSQTVKATGDYLQKQKDAAVELAQKNYAQMEQETNQLISKIKTSAPQDWEKMTTDLQGKLDLTHKKLQELEGAGKDTWQDTQNAFDAAVKELKQAYQKVKAEFEKPAQEN
jgi:thiamine biosynthesis lipoprotein ApbE